MNFVISLNAEKGIIIPFERKEPIMSAIYNILSSKIPEKIKHIHDNQLIVDGKPIKPYVFSNLYFASKTVFKGFGVLVEGNGTLYFSTSDQEIAEALLSIVGQKLFINNSFISITGVSEKKYSKQNTGLLKTLSEVVISNVGTYNGFLQRRFLSPTDEGYIELLKTNIIRKSNLMFGVPLKKDNFEIEVLSTTKTGKLDVFRNQKIKSYPLCLKITGLEADKAIQTAVTLGIGTKNALGFGYVVPINEFELKEVINLNNLIDLRKLGE